MKVVDRYLNIVCKDALNEEVQLDYCDYDETIDEIKIRTNFRNTSLYRGWVGDLAYNTIVAYEYDSIERTEDTAKSEYKDVLLASITPCAMDDGIITWEYRFLKK